jgi:hypothetical protein
MQLTKNFTLAEMLHSQIAVRHNITKQFNPPQSVINHLKLLCENVLQPPRNKIRKPIFISSGYRCRQVNDMVGGSAKSQHLTGQAADFTAADFTPEELFQYIKASNILYDQLIQEFDQWVHISYHPIREKNRKQCLRAVKQKGKTIYLTG